jgi:hypothetical protein
MDTRDEASQAKATLIAVIVAVTLASVAYRLLMQKGEEHTALVFIGIPALLAVAAVLAPKPKSGQGVTARAVAIALLISGIVFGEGFVCILFASPLFFFVGALVTSIVETVREHRGGRGLRSYVLVLFLLTPPALEGVAPGIEAGREETVTVERTVAGDPADVARALARTPDFAAPLPRFLRLGFPTPGATAGQGLRVGDERSVVLDHGHHGSGALVMRVSESDSAHVRFDAVSDRSYVVHWLTWRGADVTWTAAGPGRTRVVWTLRYRRRLDPAWYFGPLERYGARTAAGYLIDALATPHWGT